MEAFKEGNKKIVGEEEIRSPPLHVLADVLLVCYNSVCDVYIRFV